MDYELFIIGAGPGGYEAAIRAAQLGMKVALAEEREVGGTCLNRGCIPAKALLHAAGQYAALADMGQWGIRTAAQGFDYARMAGKARDTVGGLRKGVETLLAQNGVELLRGRAAVAGQGRVRVNDKTYTARHILLAVGSKPAVPPIPGADAPGVVTSDGLLARDTAPESLVIIGGGVIGVEFASLYAALGCRVTLIEAMDRLLPLLDREIGQNLSMILKKRGVEIFPSASVERIERDNGLRCVFTHKGERKETCGDTALIATGRRANTDGLFEGALPQMERGCLVTDENAQTTIPGVYAVGDAAAGSVQLAHAAAAQGIACAERLAGHTPKADLRWIPSCVYTDPEIACVGMTAEEARVKGIDTVTGKAVMTANARTVIDGGERGFIKLVFSAGDEVLLGAQMMCQRASDLIAEVTLAAAGGMTRAQMLRSVRPHPTYAEALGEALESVEGRAVHMAPPRRR
ncbi:MAG: dihydrolipoyl dehydrogenase [Eubacteriales bacterium]|nr:dihydrolipoyl dehydrogenase [Eubacteriales bacterium]